MDADIIVDGGVVMQGSNEEGAFEDGGSSSHSHDSGSDGGSDDGSGHDDRDADSRDDRSSLGSEPDEGPVDLSMLPPEVKLERAMAEFEAHVNARRHDDAIRALAVALSLNRIIYGKMHWRCARAHLDLARAYLELKSLHAQALSHAQKARDVWSSAPQAHRHTAAEGGVGASAALVAEIFCVMGTCLSHLDKFSDAEEALYKAEKSLGTAGAAEAAAPMMLEARVVHEMGRLAMRQGRLDRACELLRKAHDMLDSRAGSESALMGAIARDLGQAEQKRGNTDDAVKWSVHAHEVFAVVHGARSKETARALRQAALALVAAGDDDEAEPLVSECVLALEGACGAEDPRSLEMREEWGRLLARQGKPDEALRVLKRLGRSQSLACGPRSIQLGDTRKLMATIYLSTGDIDNAAKYFNKTFLIYKQHFGVDNARTKEIVGIIASVSKDARPKETLATNKWK
eukprot:Opistho-1_new@19788